MESFTEVWNLVCDYCKSKITEIAYSTWIKRIEPVTLDFAQGVAVLKVPNELHRQTIKHYYIDMLEEAFAQIFGQKIQIRICTPDEAGIEKQNDETPAINDDYEFTFDTYIVGPSNKFAHAASMAVASKPATLYNPLFIYGNSGLGKTHLLYAICNEISHTHPEMNIIYIKGDDFTNELIEAIRRGTTAEFHNRYRKADVFLVDDIQFIAGKDSTQEEFFHTFNTLYEAKKQIVLTSDRPPKDIATLEERLLTRFEWGLTADIQPPDFETRIAIIKRKAELLEIDMSDSVAEYIANRLKNNIRQLEGAVKKMKAYFLLAGESPSITTAQAAISDIINNDQPTPLTVEKIIDEVARTFGTSSDDIRSSKRSANISSARQVSMYVVREITQLPMTSIGKEFGGRDHSTVVYAIQQVEKGIAKDPKFKATVEDIVKNIRDR
ncbi:chromosomal replication initiator protein DnaA [Caproiciproducens galactitolivorans]|uniref:Chromosomal replication initiator protein DnaA n=1 Tax=Caproiciproducens galactitolivorans TaxID=642589 RepID=A0A4Z0XZ61_9FIRM|nr:chromosomal replication initiator protein DnaA [Caproiciproducens galactitolivorans]QEY35199.1 chromosomal replication initiator protein DnaA [Caproiciproducens galactitolivorans]TGJ76889.1 chromosomal replication initiator protein DnaA [Caproiciproducens galactitolivorans]